MLRSLVRATVVSILSLAAPATLAAEGRTPVFAPGTVLGTDGKYIVTRNIASPGGPVITIAAPNVDLDLNGFLLTGAGAPVINAAGGADHISIRNGVLAGGTIGIDIPGFTRKVDIEDVKIHNPTGGAGIHLGDVEGAALRRNEITDTPNEGILWDGPAPVKHGTIEGNLLRRTSAGIVVMNQCSSVGIINNRLEEPGTGAGGAFPGNGIVLVSCGASLVSENTVEAARVDGIFLVASKGNKLFDNVVTTCRGNGIHTDAGTSDTLILNNVASRNGTGLLASGGSGLFIEGPTNLAERNLLNNNNGAGLHYCGPAACGNTLGRNTARGNTGGIIPAFCGACGAFGAGATPPNSCNVACGVPNSSYGDNLIPGPPIF